MGMKQDWFAFSSSSGETLEKLYRALRPESQKALKGIFIDRECGAINVAKNLIGTERVHIFNKKDFESSTLPFLKNHPKKQALILLCGFFGILSKNFLDECPFAVINTHPSLLPAFPGLDKKVHQAVFEHAHFSGFTMHLVNESLDGGAIVYQKSTSIVESKSWEESRERVRQLEQRELPKAWDKILEWPLSACDRHSNARDILQRFPILY